MLSLTIHDLSVAKKRNLKMSSCVSQCTPINNDIHDANPLDNLINKAQYASTYLHNTRECTCGSQCKRFLGCI